MNPWLLVAGIAPPPAPGGIIVPLLTGLLCCCPNRAFFGGRRAELVNLGSMYCALEFEVGSQKICPPLLRSQLISVVGVLLCV